MNLKEKIQSDLEKSKKHLEYSLAEDYKELYQELVTKTPVLLKLDFKK